MKRYKDCTLHCTENQTPCELLDIVMEESKTQSFLTERYSTLDIRDTLAVYIQEEKFPYSRLIICTDTNKNGVSIVNIVPMPESGISHIDYSEYNKILDYFRDKVFYKIINDSHNHISENTEDFNIEEVIPYSFSKLNTWLSNFPLSGHPLDERRWYDFVISLHKNNEDLSIDVFKKYLQEKYNWEEDVVESFALKLESQLDLLDYYDSH